MYYALKVNIEYILKSKLWAYNNIPLCSVFFLIGLSNNFFLFDKKHMLTIPIRTRTTPAVIPVAIAILFVLPEPSSDPTFPLFAEN